MVSSVRTAFLTGEQPRPKRQRRERREAISFVAKNAWWYREVAQLVEGSVAFAINWRLPANELIRVCVPKLKIQARGGVAMTVDRFEVDACRCGWS